MIRIGGGSYRGRQLRAPKGEATRPTSGMVRESLFNILAHELPDARVLDLFAGCGSVGLEAISRGAAHATLVEKSRPALACLTANIAILGVANQVAVLPIAVERALEQLAAGDPFDIIFLDPPFSDLTAYHDVLTRVAAGGILSPNGIFIAQHDARTTLPEQAPPLTRYRVQRVGDNALSFYQYTSI